MEPASQPGMGPTRGAIVAGIVVVVVAGALVGVTLFSTPGRAALSTGGPSSNGATPTSSNAVLLAPPTTAPTSGPTPVPTPGLVVAPLTGLRVSLSVLRQPVIAVMIDDHAAARPQSGFNAADVVWQAPAEGGIPRYMLVFQSTMPTTVGPIRSAREYFLEWASEWKALYVHAGGSPQALTTLRAHGGGAWLWNGDEFAWGPYFWRVKFNVAPHNLYTDGSHLEALARRVHVSAVSPAAMWMFAPDAMAQDRPVGASVTVTYPYESITFRYDWATNTYRRFINGSKTPQVDAGDHEVVAPKNVVVLRMRFGPLNDGEPYKHRLEANDVGSGPAYISTNGLTITGTWRKSAPTAPTLLFDGAGRPVALTAGQTFVEVMTLTDQVVIRPGATPRHGPTAL